MFLLYMWCMEAFVYKYILNYLLTNIEDDMEVVTKPPRYQGIFFNSLSRSSFFSVFSDSTGVFFAAAILFLRVQLACSL